MKKRSLTVFFASAWMLALLGSVSTGCSFDNEEEYYADLMCDTANVTYSGSVAPIIATNCTSCHSPSGGFVNFQTYDDLKMYIDENPSMIPTSIRHGVGVEPMPQAAPKLPECDIRKIELWILAGYPNN